MEKNLNQCGKIIEKTFQGYNCYRASQKKTHILLIDKRRHYALTSDWESIRSKRVLYLGTAAGQNVHLMLCVETTLQEVGKVFSLQAS